VGQHYKMIFTGQQAENKRLFQRKHPKWPIVENHSIRVLLMLQTNTPLYLSYVPMYVPMKVLN
jgi:hypothetical protein